MGRWSVRIALVLGVMATIQQEAASQETPKPGPRFVDVRVGFEQTARSGCWTPIAIDLTSIGRPFKGTVSIEMPDSEAVAVTYLVKEVSIASGEQITVRHHLYLEGDVSSLAVRLRNEEGELADQWFAHMQSASAIDTPDYSQVIVAAIGSPSGIETLAEVEVAETPEQSFSTTQSFQRVLLCRRLDDLPTQWFAWQGVDVVVLTTDETTVLDAFDSTRAAALKTWVRQGGRLVVSVANNWQIVAESFLGDMLPARLEGVSSAGRLSPEVGAIELLAGGAKPLPVTDKGVFVAKLGDVRGKRLPQDVDEASASVIVRGEYGFGQVTLVGIDVNASPFRDWNGRRDFWTRVAGVPSGTGSANPNPWDNQSRVTQVIDRLLDDFRDVTIVPFAWVAAFIIGYILLIGPVEYFVLKKLVGRLEWTWITFPLLVLLVSAGAYLAAFRLKGDNILVNRVEVLDVDAASQTLRGVGFSSIFSPRIDRYSLTCEPSLAVAGTWESAGMGRAPLDRVSSTVGNLAWNWWSNSRGSGGLFGSSGYAVSIPEPTTVRDVPIRVWSVKNFQSRWLARGADVVAADLHRGDLLKDSTGLRGSVSNKLSSSIEDIHLFFGEYVFRLGTLAPGANVTLALEQQIPLSTFVSNMSQGNIGFDSYNAVSSISFENSSWIHPFLIDLTFPDNQVSSDRASSQHLLSPWALSEALTSGRAILVGRLTDPAGKLWINATPTPGADPPPVAAREQRISFLRVVLEPTNDD
jgi:hypothetical protein